MLSNNDLSKILAQHRGHHVTVVVDAFLINDAMNEILLQKRSPNRRIFPNFWDAIGGHLEGEETILEGLEREIKEESSMELTEVLKFVNHFEWPEDSTVINFQFLCRARGQFQPEADKVTEVRWFREADLPFIASHLTPSMSDGLRRAFLALNDRT
jgi:8-oxo-dGTP diphosphatase